MVSDLSDYVPHQNENLTHRRSDGCHSVRAWKGGEGVGRVYYILGKFVVLFGSIHLIIYGERDEESDLLQRE